MSTPERHFPRWLPIARWLSGYHREYLVADLVAGFVTAVLLIPQGLAFALLAGLPPHVGLYASVLPPLVYAVFGTSRTVTNSLCPCGIAHFGLWVANRRCAIA